MNTFDILQLIGGGLLALSYIPQIIKTHKLKKVDEISIQFWGVLFIGLCMMEMNAIHLISLGTWSYAITETLNVIGCGIFLGQVIFYGQYVRIWKEWILDTPKRRKNRKIRKSVRRG